MRNIKLRIEDDHFIKFKLGFILIKQTSRPKHYAITQKQISSLKQNLSSLNHTEYR